MEGHRLIIKRKIPKGREKLVAIFIGTFAVAGLVMLAQLKATLSAKALISVQADLVDIRGRLNEDVGPGPEPATVPSVAGESQTAAEAQVDSAVEKFKKLIQDSAEQTPK